MSEIIPIASDHAGVELKERLKRELVALGYAPLDMGTNSTDSVDYPDFAHAVAKAVGAKHVDAGIIIDGAGIGSASHGIA